MECVGGLRFVWWNWNVSDEILVRVLGVFRKLFDLFIICSTYFGIAAPSVIKHSGNSTARNKFFRANNL